MVTFESESRLANPALDYYKHVYYFSKKWDGKMSLDGKDVLVYCEQGLGDIIQFCRFLPQLKALGCKLMVHAPRCLHSLLKYLNCIDEFYDREDPILPKHDYHVMLLTVPMVLGAEVSLEPYIVVPEKEDLSAYPGKKIGIAWECSKGYPENIDRCCPLKHYKCLSEYQLFMVQDKIHRPELVAECEDLDLNGTHLHDWVDTARLLNSLDAVVSVDTAVLHLAGAMGKPAHGVLGANPEIRWEVGKWYRTFFPHVCQSGWEGLFAEILLDLQASFSLY